MLGAIAGVVGGIAKQWLSNRQKVSEARAQQKITRIQQDGTIAQKLTTGIKDELVLITVFSPVWVSMAGAAIGDPDMVARGKDVAAVMREYAPKEVWASLLVMTAVVSLGGRVSDVLDRFGFGGFKKQ